MPVSRAGLCGLWPSARRTGHATGLPPPRSGQPTRNTSAGTSQQKLIAPKLHKEHIMPIVVQLWPYMVLWTRYTRNLHLDHAQRPEAAQTKHYCVTNPALSHPCGRAKRADRSLPASWSGALADRRPCYRRRTWGGSTRASGSCAKSEDAKAPNGPKCQKKSWYKMLA
jgi:hypothetical protein